jgi:hypothetical protein
VIVTVDAAEPMAPSVLAGWIERADEDVGRPVLREPRGVERAAAEVDGAMEAPPDGDIPRRVQGEARARVSAIAPPGPPKLLLQRWPPDASNLATKAVCVVTSGKGPPPRSMVRT